MVAVDLTAVWSSGRNRYEPRIDEVPPRVWFTAEFLHIAFFAEDHLFIRIERPADGHGSTGHSCGEYDCWVPDGDVCFHNSIVTLMGINRTVIYRIGDYNRGLNAWEAAWPD